MTDPTNLSDDELFKAWRAASSTDDAVRALWDSAVAAERAHAASRPNPASTEPATEEELVEALRVVVEANQPGLQVRDALILVVRQTGTPLSDVRYALSLARSQNVVHVNSHTKEITVPKAEPEQSMSAFNTEMYWPPLNMKDYSSEDLMETLEDSSLSGIMFNSEVGKSTGPNEKSTATWAEIGGMTPLPAKNLRPLDLKEWAARMRNDSLGNGPDMDIIDQLVAEATYRHADPLEGEGLITELEWCAFFQDGKRNGELVDLAHFIRYRTAKALRDAAEELARQSRELALTPELAVGQVYVNTETNTKIIIHEEQDEPMKRIVFEPVFRAGKAEEDGTSGSGMLVTASDLQAAGYTLLSEGTAGRG